MPIDAKAGCLYPNNARALMEARSRGFDNCLLTDMLGNVAELATANIFLAQRRHRHDARRQRLVPQRDHPPARAEAAQSRRPSTRARRRCAFADFDAADEIFVVGNYGKVTPVNRIEQRDLQPGPLFRRARQLYWDFAHSK